MKKPFIFYLIWDIVFISFLYLLSAAAVQLEHYARSTFDLYPALFASLFFYIALGVLLSCLVYITGKYEFNIKLAVLELIMVGIPALFLASSFLLSFLLANRNISLPLWPYLFWIFRETAIQHIGGAVFGYEVFVFVARIVKYRRSIHLC